MKLPFGLRYVTLVLPLLATCACGSSRELTPPVQADALPSPGTLHGGRSLSEELVFGADYLLCSPDALAEGSALRLSPQPGLTAWAVYDFQAATGGLDSIAVQLDLPAGSRVWLALADCASGRWEWQGPFSASKTLATDEPRFVSGSGYVYCAILCDGAQPVLVSALSMRSQTPGNQPPLASLQVDLSSGDAPLLVHFDAAASSDPDGGIIDYAWDWDGDGAYDGVSDQPQLSHSFSQPGIYHVTLRVSDASFARATAQTSIAVTTAGNAPPQASLTVQPAAGTAPLSCSLDASGSSAGGDPGDSIVLYEWDTDGDGAFDAYGGQPSLERQYKQPGMYELRLRVTDSAGNQSEDSASLSISAASSNPPQASLSPATVSGTVPLTVDFDAGASDSGDSGEAITLYEWDLDGDGSFEAYGDSAQHSINYSAAGSFLARVRVTDAAGNQTLASVPVSLTVAGNNPPGAELSPASSSGSLPLSVDFDASGSDAGGDPGDSIALYEWDFDGDGCYEAYGSQALVSHSYVSAGSFIPRLRVTDSAGNQAVDTASVTVTQPGNNPPQAQLDASPASGYAPLSVDFDAAASDAGGDAGDSIVLYEWDWDGDGVFEAFGSAAAVTHVYADSGSFSPQLRVTDEAGNQDLASVTIDTDAQNQAPVAVIQASATDCNAGDVLNFFASASYDGDGSIIKYEWDLDGNGSYETDTGTTDHVSHSFNTAGPPLVIGLRVRDDGGYFGSDELTLSVHGWLTLTLDSAGLVGAYSCLAAIGGKPAICYQQSNNNDLLYCVSSSTSGASLSDWTLVTVDSAVDGGHYGSLCEVGGKPAISYYDGGLSDLKFAWSSTASGSSAADWSRMTLDSTGGQSTSLAIVAGNPAIAHYDGVGQDLRYIRSTTASGSSLADWSQNVVVDSSGSVGNHCSLCIVNGAPAISYADSDNGDLKFAFSSTASGSQSGDWSRIVVDDTGGGQFSSLKIVNGVPAISYYNFGNEKLMYAVSSTVGGTLANDWTHLTVDSSNTCGSYSSLAVLVGNPAISYWDYASGDLQFARSITASGSSQYDWTQKQVADGDGTASGPNVGKYSSLLVLDNLPRVAYQDVGNSDLKYAIRF